VSNRPLRRDAEENRVRILDAARDAFAHRGLDVSMDEIARRAGVGVGTVYRRFPEKELLIEALFEQRLDELVEIATEAAGMPDPWEGLGHLLERFVSVQADDRGLRDLMLSAGHAEQRVRRARDRIAPVADALVARAQESGRLRDDVVGTDLALIQFMLTSLVDYTREVEPEAWRRFLTIVLDGLRTRRAKPTGLPGAPLDDDQFAAVVKSWRP
jgi:AcrR family transcriptional regulator